MSDSEGEQENQEWLLGYLEEPASAASLLRHRLCSKVGGRPAWLNPLSLPSPEQIRCAYTKKPLIFLLQIYAAPPCGSPEDHPGAFHRSIFVFIPHTRSRICEAGGVRALRCQLPRSNAFYAAEPSDDLLPKALAAEEAVASASRDPWHVVEAERQLKGPSAVGEAPDMCQEWEMVVELDEESNSGSIADGVASSLCSGLKDGGGSLSATAVQERLRRYHLSVQKEGELPVSEAEQIDEVFQEQVPEEDRMWAHFQAVTSARPGQVLRYCIEGGKPLWGRPSPTPASIPPCPRCGAPRRFEFQVLPQLLAFLGLDDAADDAPDWLTIAVYTCSQSCVPEERVVAGEGSPSYADEFCYVQPPFQCKA